MHQGRPDRALQGASSSTVNSVPSSLQTWPGRITRLDMNDEGQGRAARERPEALMRGCSLGLRWLNGTRARFGLPPWSRAGGRKGRLPNKCQLGPLIYRGFMLRQAVFRVHKCVSRRFSSARTKLWPERRAGKGRVRMIRPAGGGHLPEPSLLSLARSCALAHGPKCAGSHPRISCFCVSCTCQIVTSIERPKIRR
jgi:hypothetical protein